MSEITHTPVPDIGGVPAVQTSTVTKRVFHGGAPPSDAERAAKRQVQQDLQKQAVTLGKEERAIVAAHEATQDKPQPAKKETPAEKGRASTGPGDGGDKPQDQPGGKTGGDDKLSKLQKEQLERANRVEARNREREARVKALEEQVNKLSVSAKELEEIRNLSKSDQITLLEKLGLDLETIGRAQIKAGRSPKKAEDKPADPADDVKSRVEALEKEKATQQQTSNFNAGLRQFVQGIEAVVLTSDASGKVVAREEYELMLLHSSEPPQNPAFINKVTEDAAQVQAASIEQGVQLTYKEIADALEAHYEREEEAKFALMSSSKKLQAKFGISKKEADQAVKQIEKPAPKKKGYETVTNKPKDPPADQPKKRLSDKERLAQVVAWGRAQHAKAELAKSQGK